MKVNHYVSISFLVLSLAFFATNVGASHVLKGKVRKEGEASTKKGLRHYWTETMIKKPVVCWEDLEKDGFQVKKCGPKKMKFVGDIDSDDFKEGNVLTFPMKDYESFGCPIAPQDKGKKETGVVFRKIESVKLGDGHAVVHTSFIKMADVVPYINFQLGELVNTERELSEASTGESLLTTSRTNNIDIEYEKTGSFTPFSGATLSYSLSATGGVCDFYIDFTGNYLRWQHTLQASAGASLEFESDITVVENGEIFKEAIPGEGFSANVFLFGRLDVGFVVALEWEIELDSGGGGKAEFGAEISENHLVLLNANQVSSTPIESTSSGTTGSFEFKENESYAAVSGFAGLRPIFGLDMDFPVFFPDNYVELGVTAGMGLEVEYSPNPFQPVDEGVLYESATCEVCHLAEGSLNFVARRLSIDTSYNSNEWVIANSLFDVPIAVFCFFERECDDVETPLVNTPPPVAAP